MDNNPIGIFDSGMGGLTVRAEIARQFPNESLIYFGDGLNVPYGSRLRSEITKFATEAAEILLAKGAKMIIVACNAATGAAIGSLREAFPQIPIVGMEPAVKPAALSTRTGAIGVLATAAAFKGELYLHTSEIYRRTIEIVEAVGEGFVELVENERIDTPEALETVRRVVEPMLAQNIDKIVLGCTHYPYLEPVIRRVIDEWRATKSTDLTTTVEIVDSAPAVARRVGGLLIENGLCAAVDHCPEHEFLTFAGDEYAARLRRLSKK